jgi:hypothetical protein
MEPGGRNRLLRSFLETYFLSEALEPESDVAGAGVLDAVSALLLSAELESSFPDPDCPFFPAPPFDRA